MNNIKDFAVVMVSTALVASLLTVFFDWRARLRSHLRGASHEH